MINGEILYRIWTMKFTTARQTVFDGDDRGIRPPQDNDPPWRCEIKTPYGDTIAKESPVSPGAAFDLAYAAAVQSLLDHTPDSARRPLTFSRKVEIVETPNKQSRLPPRRKPTIEANQGG